MSALEHQGDSLVLARWTYSINCSVWFRVGFFNVCFFFQNVTLSHGTFKLRSRPQIRKFISTIILITLSDIKSGYFQGLCLSIFVFLSKELIFTGFRRVCILHGENCGRKVQDDRNGIRTRKFCFFFCVFC